MTKQLDLSTLENIYVIGHVINKEGNSIMYYYLTPSPYFSSYVKIAVIKDGRLLVCGCLPLTIRQNEHGRKFNPYQTVICNETYRTAYAVHAVSTHVFVRHTMLGLINAMESYGYYHSDDWRDDYKTFWNGIHNLELSCQNRKTSLRKCYFLHCERINPPDHDIVIPPLDRTLDKFATDVGLKVLGFLKECGALVIPEHILKDNIVIFGKIVLAVAMGLAHYTLKKPIDEWVTMVDGLPIFTNDEIPTAEVIMDYLTNFAEYSLPEDFNTYVQFYNREHI